MHGPALRPREMAWLADGCGRLDHICAHLDHVIWLGQTSSQDPHELRRRRRSDLGPRVRQVVLHGRVRQAEAVGGRLLRPGNEDRGDHPDLTIGRACRSPFSHASRLAAATHSSRPSIGIS